MKVTVSFDIAKTDIKWSGIANHVKHLPNQNHKNKDIQFDLTKYNSSTKITKRSIDDFYNREELKDFIKQHDAKMLKNRHKNLAFGDINGWLAKQKNPERVAIMTFGNMETKQEIMEKLGISREQFAKLTNKALKKWCRMFIHANPDIKLTHAVTNVDEKGAPHVHIAFRPLSFHNGKPSVNINKAIADELHSTQPANKNLAAFREREDQRLIKAFNETFKDNGYDLQFALTRTHSNIKRLDMATYKDLEHQQDALNAQQQQQEQQQVAINQRDTALQQREDRVQEQSHDNDVYQEILNDYDDTLQQRKRELEHDKTAIYDEINNTSLYLAAFQQDNNGNYLSTDDERETTRELLQPHITNGDCNITGDHADNGSIVYNENMKIVNSTHIFHDLLTQAMEVCARLERDISQTYHSMVNHVENMLHSAIPTFQHEHEDRPKFHGYHYDNHDDGMEM